MNHVDIVIPTQNRFQSLVRTLQSIPKLPFISVIVVCDGDLITHERLHSTNLVDKNFYVKSHSGSVFCRNMATQYTDDGVLFATDCVTFGEGSVERCIEEFNTNFPNDDGVYAFNFSGRGSCTSVPLLGKIFINRFSSRMPFCPEYFHFACQELSSLCKELELRYGRKFLFLDSDFTVEKKITRDYTYKDARKYKDRDMKLKEQRERENLIWGL